MKLNYVIIYVDDVVKATEFYQTAFGLNTKFIHESNTYAEMETGATVLAFAHNELLKSNIGIDAQIGLKNCFEIALSTPNVHSAFEKAVQNGAKELAKPKEKPWGQTVAYVQDMFGTIIEICSPIE